MNKKICVFCSSSDAISSEYLLIASQLGELIARNNDILLFGGARVGLMKTIADSVKKNNGKVIGVIPELIKDKGLTYTMADEIIISKDLRDRKAKMEQLADAFIALPGGFGTLDEIIESITQKQLAYHSKPVIFLNLNNFFCNLFLQFETSYKEKFAKDLYKELYFVASCPDEVYSYLENYTAFVAHNKWYKSVANPHFDL